LGFREEDDMDEEIEACVKTFEKLPRLKNFNWYNNDDE